MDILVLRFLKYLKYICKFTANLKKETPFSLDVQMVAGSLGIRAVCPQPIYNMRNPGARNRTRSAALRNTGEYGRIRECRRIQENTGVPENTGVMENTGEYGNAGEYRRIQECRRIQ